MSSPAYIPADELIEALGLVSALKLVEAFGGTSIYSPGPEKLRADHALVKAIGMESARKFAAEWRHLDVMLPRCKRALRRRRDRALRADAESLSVRKLALKYDLTERQIYRLLALSSIDEADDRAARAQPELF